MKIQVSSVDGKRNLRQVNKLLICHITANFKRFGKWKITTRSPVLLFCS